MFTDESRKKISDALKNKWQDPEFRKNQIKKLIETGVERGKKVSASYTNERRKEYAKRLSEMWIERGGLNPHAIYKDEKHPAWKGNDAKYEAIHIRMRQKYLKDHCETCGVTQIELRAMGLRGLALHCNTDDIYIDDKSNWSTYCTGCHTALHHKRRKLEKEIKENE